MLYKRGDLLANVQEGVLVHGCNAQGVMASGIAKQIKAIYPDAYLQYMDDYLEERLTLGFCSIVKHEIHEEPLYIVSAITQQFYGRDPNVRYVDYEAIGKVFLYLKSRFPGMPVNIPKIGAGLGNGNWDQISTIIDAIHPRVICWEL